MIAPPPEVKTERQSCSNCRFSGNSIGGLLICRRKAPIVVVTLIQQPHVVNGQMYTKTNVNELNTIWPVIHGAAWCGDWAGKVVVKK